MKRKHFGSAVDRFVGAVCLAAVSYLLGVGAPATAPGVVGLLVGAFLVGSYWIRRAREVGADPPGPPTRGQIPTPPPAPRGGSGAMRDLGREAGRRREAALRLEERVREIEELSEYRPMFQRLQAVGVSTDEAARAVLAFRGLIEGGGGRSVPSRPHLRPAPPPPAPPPNMDCRR